MDPIEAAAKALWPEAELVSILEEALSIDRAANSVPIAQLNSRIVELARYAERLNTHGILYTCSAFGEGIEEAARTSNLPILKPNEAMYDAALECGNSLAMVYTFPPSVGGMEKEFITAAKNSNSQAKMRSVYADGALDALKNGDATAHDRIIAEVAMEVDDADAILLAQFSMSTAASTVRAMTDTPVLTSPESAIEKMKQSVEHDQGHAKGQVKSAEA